VVTESGVQEWAEVERWVGEVGRCTERRDQCRAFEERLVDLSQESALVGSVAPRHPQGSDGFGEQEIERVESDGGCGGGDVDEAGALGQRLLRST